MDLLEEMRLAFAQAKRWQMWATLSGVTVYCAAVAAAFVSSRCWVAAIGGVSLTAQVLASIFRRLSHARYALGEEVRQTAFLADSLGQRASELQLAKLRDRVGQGTHSEPPVLGQYYGSNKTPGAERLLDNLAESSYWTMGLARTTRNLHGLAVGAGICVVVLVTIMLVELGLNGGAMASVAKIAALTLAMVATSGFAAQALDFAALSRSSERVFDRCDEMIRHRAPPC